MGVANRIQAQKVIPSAIKVSGGHTTTWLETANRLLHVLIRDGSPDDGNLIQVRMRRDSGVPPNTENCRHQDEIVLELAMGRL